MSFKSKPSGAEFRKRREEKDEKSEKVIKNVPKITTFFREMFKVKLVMMVTVKMYRLFPMTLLTVLTSKKLLLNPILYQNFKINLLMLKTEFM